MPAWGDLVFFSLGFVRVQVCLFGCISCFGGVGAMAALIAVGVSAVLVPRGAPFED